MTLRFRLAVAFSSILLAPVALGAGALALAAAVAAPLLVAFGVGTAVAAVLGWWLAAVATRPLCLLVDVADRALAGDLSVRTAIGGRDEAARLGLRLDALVAALREARRLSVTDPLTGLRNRRQLVEDLRRETERAVRFGRALGVLVLDLDNFKGINDRHGHGAGDDVLVEFSARVRRVVRVVDPTFRHGGEEFVILLPETDVAGALTAAGRVRDAVRVSPFPVSGRSGETAVAVTVSIGVAVFPRHARTAAGLLDAADQALYAAKEAGRDAVVLAGERPPAPVRTATQRPVVGAVARG